jgi:hypothetical protein
VDIEEGVARRVEQVATDRKTTVSALLREYLESLATGDVRSREEARRRLAESFTRLSRDMGPRQWTREDLYER